MIAWILDSVNDDSPSGRETTAYPTKAAALAPVREAAVGLHSRMQRDLAEIARQRADGDGDVDSDVKWAEDADADDIACDGYTLTKTRIVVNADNILGCINGYQGATLERWEIHSASGVLRLVARTEAP